MAVTVDNATVATTMAGVTSRTGSVTSSASANRIVVALVPEFDSGAGLSGLTVDGSATTLIGTSNNGSGNRNTIREIIAPATGANSVVASSAANMFGELAMIAASGVDQVTPFGTYASATATSTALSVTITGAVGDLIVVCAIWDTGTLTTPAGWTAIVNRGTSGQPVIAAYIIATGTSTTFSNTLSASNKWAAAGVAIKADTGGAVALPPKNDSYLVIY